MIYLKYFLEGVSYQELNGNYDSYEDFFNEFGQSWVSFTLDELNILVNRFSEHQYSVMNDRNDLYSSGLFNKTVIDSSWGKSKNSDGLKKYGDKLFTFKVHCVMSLGEEYFIHIRSLDDEWYWVLFYSQFSNTIEYYKCDQMEGLLKLMNDKL